MKSCRARYVLPSALFLCVTAAALWTKPVTAQWPFSPPTTPDAQRSAVNAVKSQINWLQNATRTASSFGAQGWGNVWQTFQAVREAHNAFKLTLTPQQQADGANALAELDAGLDILQEAFANYQQDLAGGRAVGPALQNMCRVLRQGSDVWLQEFNKTCSRLRVGW